MNLRRQIRTSIAAALAMAAIAAAWPAASAEWTEVPSAIAQNNIVSADATIAFYETKVRQLPTLYAGFAALGSAYLDKARDTHDSAWLVKARNATDRSLELRPNLSALSTMAAICNFSHRFACGLGYAAQAARIRPGDEGSMAMLVEAELGLGRLDAADQLIQDGANEETSSSVLVARGRWFAEQGRFDDACESFVAAAEQARKTGADDLVIWAETNAARMLLDLNRPDAAQAHLESASALQTSSWPVMAALEVHWAELHEMEGRSAAALVIYESILARQEDPELYRRAFLLARQLGDEQRAAKLLAAGERAAEKIREAGEIFGLEPQARLYADAGIKLERALELAQQNLEYKKDRSARETLAYVEQKLQRTAAAR